MNITYVKGKALNEPTLCVCVCVSCDVPLDSKYPHRSAPWAHVWTDLVRLSVQEVPKPALPGAQVPHLAPHSMSGFLVPCDKSQRLRAPDANMPTMSVAERACYELRGWLCVSRNMVARTAGVHSTGRG